MGVLKDLTNQRFGRLFVIAREPNVGKHVLWRCVCDCGVTTKIKGIYLYGGDTTSCGCRQKETSRLGHPAFIARARSRGAPTCSCLGPRKRPRDSLCNRHRTLWHKYQLSPEVHEQMFQAQHSSCVICCCDLTQEQAVVDHCHKSGDIRGILCHLCNRGLGNFHDDPKLLRKAAVYVETPRSSSIKARIVFGLGGTTKVKERVYPMPESLVEDGDE